MLSTTLMATGNINCPLLARDSEFPKSFNLSYPGTTSILQDMGSAAAYLDLQVSNDEVYPTQELTVNVFDNECINHTAGFMNNNENKVSPQQTQETQFPQSLDNMWGLNENILQWKNEIYSRPQKQLQLIQSIIPEEQLTINIEADEGGMHSWRPNLTNSLCPDFFVAQPGSDNVVTPEDEIEQLHTTPQLLLWDSGIGKETITKKTDTGKVTNNSYSDYTNHPRIDIQSHLQSQRTQLNSLKYEVMNAKRRQIESKAVVEKLTNELKEKLLLQNSKDIQKLRDHNAQLRLECQCLCMEVDFYLKGKAPLGEVDESFYKGSVTQDKKADIETAVQPQIGAEHLDYNSEEQEEANKWECPKCTFANHPAINSCEMCHMPRVRRETPLLSSVSNTCYCHPKEEPNFS